MNDNLFYRQGRRRYRKPAESPSKKDVLSKAKWVFYGLIVVCVGLLLFKGFTTLLGKIQSSSVEELATIHVVVGDVQLSSLNNGNYVSVYSGEKLWVQDKLRTMSNSRAVITLFDGTQVRMDESTVVSFTRLEQDGDDNYIDLVVDTGNVWVNTPQVLVGNTELSVSTKYTKSTFNNSVVAVTSNLPEYVRVISGMAEVDIVENTSKYESLVLASGQQLQLTNAMFEQIRSGSTPDALQSELDTRFSISQWARWNGDEDESPSFGLDNSVVIDPSDTGSDPILFDADLNGEFIETTEDGIDPAIQPVFTSHENGDVVEGGEILELRGTVPANTSNVMIISYEDGPSNPFKYTLKGFKEGDKTFLYRAEYDPPTGNLVEGENIYEAVAIDARGDESLPTRLTITYVPDEEDESTEEDSNETSVDRLELNAELGELPEIVSINDVPYTDGFVLDERKGVIKFSIGKWAKDVVVNGFQLTLYDEYSGEFQFILSPGFENVKQGDNLLQVYGIDKDGRRSKVEEFVINYQYEE